jgi:hypothetical protein
MDSVRQEKMDNGGPALDGRRSGGWMSSENSIRLVGLQSSSDPGRHAAAKWPETQGGRHARHSVTGIRLRSGNARFQTDSPAPCPNDDAGSYSATVRAFRTKAPQTDPPVAPVSAGPSGAGLQKLCRLAQRLIVSQV